MRGAAAGAAAGLPLLHGGRTSGMAGCVMGGRWGVAAAVGVNGGGSCVASVARAGTKGFGSSSSSSASGGAMGGGWMTTRLKELKAAADTNVAAAKAVPTVGPGKQRSSLRRMPFKRGGSKSVGRMAWQILLVRS